VFNSEIMYFKKVMNVENYVLDCSYYGVFPLSVNYFFFYKKYMLTLLFIFTAVNLILNRI